jgi:hypothetical protein
VPQLTELQGISQWLQGLQTESQHAHNGGAMGSPRTIAIGLTGALALLTACGHKGQPASTGSGSPTTPTSPTAPPTPAEPPPSPTPRTCTFVLTADASFQQEISSGVVRVSTTPDCLWTLSKDATWLSVEEPLQSQGAGTRRIWAAANGDTPTRSATISLADQKVVLTQPGQGECAYQVTPTTAVLPRAGRTADIAVATAAGCKWSATTDAPWLHLDRPSASGSGRLSYRADANPGVGREGFRYTQVKIRWQAPTAGQNVLVSQGGSCSVVAGTRSGPGSQTGDTLAVGAAGGAFHLEVLTDPFMNCPWSVTTNDSWLTIDAPRNGTGSGDGDVHITVAANPSAQSRQGVLDFGEVRIKVVQAGR